MTEQGLHFFNSMTGFDLWVLGGVVFCVIGMIIGSIFSGDFFLSAFISGAIYFLLTIIVAWIMFLFLMFWWPWAILLTIASIFIFFIIG